jgi:hypothetical protein
MGGRLTSVSDKTQGDPIFPPHHPSADILTGGFAQEDAVKAKPKVAAPKPDAVLKALIARLDAKDQKLFRAVRTALRKRFPTANELAYDYGKQFLLAYGPGDRGIDALVSIVARANGLQLAFTQGKHLPDPKKLLSGSGQSRYIQLESTRQLSHPELKALFAAAIDEATVPLPSKGKGQLIIKATAASKRG